MTNVDNPLKWLLGELPDYMAPQAHAELMERFERQKHRYYTVVKINDLERKIKTNERFAQSPERDARIARWRSRLDELRALAQPAENGDAGHGDHRQQQRGDPE